MGSISPAIAQQGVPSVESLEKQLRTKRTARKAAAQAATLTALQPLIGEWTGDAHGDDFEWRASTGTCRMTSLYSYTVKFTDIEPSTATVRGTFRRSFRAQKAINSATMACIRSSPRGSSLGTISANRQDDYEIVVVANIHIEECQQSCDQGWSGGDRVKRHLTLRDGTLRYSDSNGALIAVLKPKK
ncbi:hypothetical protein [Steroidobacter sp.]|uniref:hypothetical protein n=1 Tax=Steroidobacter sp. TaxID=1978227 RepID=UPI001A5566B1|nr:hypothetical protein [Steroidobacter sp.]MBL8270979.1 hypothetical protein [Steroidobacter sp.]